MAPNLREGIEFALLQHVKRGRTFRLRSDVR